MARKDLTERFGREARDPCEVTQVSWKRSTDKKTADSSRRVIASGRIGDEARKLGHATASDRLRWLGDYEDAGLTVLSISRHSHDKNTEIMSLDTKSESVADTWRDSGLSLQL